MSEFKKFPKRDWKAHAEQYYETVKKWHVDTKQKLKERYQAIGNGKPSLSLNDCIQTCNKLELIIVELLEALK